MTTANASQVWTTTIIFACTYLAMALGRVPRIRIDRAGIAFVGTAAMLVFGVLDLREAAAAVDAETIALLLGMMILVAYLQLAGFFAWVTQHVAVRFAGPHALLAVTIMLSGILSALLVNDVVCVALTPLVLDLCRRLNRQPIPYLVGLATASNVGSVATITGNPQNIIIGSLSGIPYLRFAARLAPVAAIGLALTYLIVALVYRRQLAEDAVAVPSSTPPEPLHIHRRLLIKSVLVTVVTIILFFAGQPIALVALGAASICLLDGVRPAKVYRRIDWPLLVMFAGLFIVVHAFESQVVRGWHLQQWAGKFDSPVVIVSGLSVVLSNLVSNVPAVLLFKPLMAIASHPEQAWLALAMSSTLAGNLTVLGSVANLIVVETARRAGVELSFVEYLKVGVVLTTLTTLVGIAWLSWTVY